MYHGVWLNGAMQQWLHLRGDVWCLEVVLNGGQHWYRLWLLVVGGKVGWCHNGFGALIRDGGYIEE